MSVLWAMPDGRLVTLTPRALPESLGFVRTLFDFEGPLVVTFTDHEHNLFVGWWADVLEDGHRWLVIPTTAELIDALTDGDLASADFFGTATGPVYVIDFRGPEMLRAFDLPDGKVPPELVPEPGSYMPEGDDD